jgi:hypothetical protein
VPNWLNGVVFLVIFAGVTRSIIKFTRSES